MSYLLPSDCTQFILSYLSLQYFSELISEDELWKARFQYRYGERLNGNYKRLYLLRAATEHHEVCAGTIDLYNGDLYLYYEIMCYHAARGGNWACLSSYLNNKVPNEYYSTILTLAMNADQLDIVRTTNLSEEESVYG